ncbi:STY0301 family protein [Massilia sp.]|uniref:STY0301 family protein n=1 Tax=Massilia sp. TaxID=1882437 RepID=UPI0028A6F942|nr:STY0301 family protein [Massilia sp.]
MKAAILALGLALAPAQAEVIECPAKHQGVPLLGGSVYEGPQKQYELMGELKEVRSVQNGYFRFDADNVKWVACWYRPGAPVWHRVQPGVTRCEVQERGALGQLAVKVSCN